MDDVLDEWNLSLIQLQKGQQDSSSVASQQHKVCPFIPRSSCLGFKKIVTRRDIALKIKYVKAQIDEILKERNRYDFLENQGPDHSLVRVTTSFVEIDDVKGREIDKDKLVKKITSRGTSSSQGDHIGPIHISSIVGTGGIGKTTLAQLVYNDERVKDCFPLRIWICVSDPFDEALIAREIVRKARGSAPSIVSLEGLLELVQESISGKKFLLVLDDVWNGDDTKWGPLKSSLKSSCAAGSRILVTTRKDMVARNIGTNENEIYPLEQLSDDECWSLLSHIAFFGRSEGMKEGLVKIGRGIAQKCRGLPLAAKTLGSLLRFKSTVEEWEDVLDSEIWRLESTKVDLFPHLNLSYNDLPSAQKRCFSYCGVFPKDHEIYVDDLIRKWMALGYLSSDEGNASELELRGREYFDSLASRCLFQNFQKDGDVIFKCKMHDIVHDFAQSLMEEHDLNLSKEANNCKICSPLVSPVIVYRSLILKGDDQADLRVCDCRARARVLDFQRFRNISIKIEKFIHLRNLYFLGVNVNDNDIRVICMLYNLQSLELAGCGLREISSEIGNLSQLRHLDLRYNGELNALPDSISDLHELRSLSVIECASLSKLPQGIDGLVNLKHLQVAVSFSHDGPLKYPQGLAKLTSLQTLDEFNGGGDCNKLGLLNKLNRLSRSLELGIKLVEDDDDIVGQAREAELRMKMHLQELRIRFVDEMDKEEEGSMRRRLDVMVALQPHPNLQSLTIWHYKGSRFPEWMASPSFHQLRQIQLFNCDLCLSLPHLGKLLCLEELEIRGFEKVELVGREFLGTTLSSSIGFPKLKKLEFRSCSKWKEWEDITEEEEEEESAAVSVMPSLIQLEIYKCPNLKELPHRLLRKASSLQKLTFDDINVDENDIRVICMLYNLQSLVVSHCGLREIPSEIGNLSQLRNLDLSFNKELRELSESISDLHELRRLCISQDLTPVSTLLKYGQGLAKLTSLQTLDQFYGGGDWNMLGLLNKLNRLSGSLLLQIKLVEDDDDIVEQAREAELRKKRHLQSLEIKFWDYMDEENREEEGSMRRRLDVMDALQPHPDLQSLKIYNYKGSRFPEWIASPSFHQLREIKLFHFNSCLSLPPLEKLSCLEELTISSFDKFELLGREFLGVTSSIGFPKLKKLLFYGCFKWKEWEDITAEEEESAAVSVMPSLTKLSIYYCSSLRELPHRLLRKASSLQTLSITYSPPLLEAYKEGGPLAKFISHIPNVVFNLY